MLMFGRPVPIAEVVSKLDLVDEMAVRSLARNIVSRPVTIAAIGPIRALDSYEEITKRLL
jgi:hypothetical protein